MLQTLFLLVLTLILAGAPPAPALPIPADEAPLACPGYLVTRHWQRLHYLELLSRPRPLNASGRDLELSAVLRELLSDAPVRVTPREFGAGVVSQVSYQADDEGALPVEMIWSHLGQVTRRLTLPTADPSLGEVGLRVSRRDDGYLAEYGPDVEALYHDHRVGPHLAGGPRYLFSWFFEKNAELREIRVKTITPRDFDGPIVDATSLKVNR